MSEDKIMDLVLALILVFSISGLIALQLGFGLIGILLVTLSVYLVGYHSATKYHWIERILNTDDKEKECEEI